MRRYLPRLLLLHPVPRATHQMHAAHIGARSALHLVKLARFLVGAPVALACDEHGGHVYAAAGPGFAAR